MAYNFPPVNKIFDDLDRFRDYCRFEGKVFNEADLYKNDAPVWQAYQKYLNWSRSKNRNFKPFDRKPRFNNTRGE